MIEQVRAGGGASAFDTKQIFQGLVKDTIEAFLELEMEEHLGYAKHEAEGRNSGNSRNGASSKTVRGDFGEVERETPRDLGIENGGRQRRAGRRARTGL